MKPVVQARLDAEEQKSLARLRQLGWSPSKAVREGLRLLELRERERDEAFKLLKAKLRRAAERSEKGATVDAEEYLDQLIEKLKCAGGK